MNWLQIAFLSMAIAWAPLARAQVVSIGTNPIGSFAYSAAAGLAKVFQEKAGMTARVQAMSGTTTITPLVNRGQIEFGMLNSFDVVSAVNGGEGFEKPNPDLRLVGVIYVLPLALGVPNDSTIKEIKDLKGMRMPAQYTAQRISNYGQNAMLATAGLSTADMKPYPVADYMKGMASVAAGRTDAGLFGVGSAAAQEAHAELASRGGLRFLPVPDGPEALAALRKVFPTAYTKVFQPNPAFPGVVGPTRVMVFSMFLVASKHVSDEVVYKATKALYENKPTLEATAATFKSFDPRLMAEANSVPFHPGAEKFYREVGMWPPKERQ